MKTITIKAVTPEAEEICSIRLVGYFDSNRRLHPALDLLRFDNKRQFEIIVDYAAQPVGTIENLLICELASAKDLVFDDVKYEFDVQSFSESISLRYLV